MMLMTLPSSGLGSGLGTTQPQSPLVQPIADAIAQMEGYNNTEQTLAKINNNPGNLRSWGGVPTNRGYAAFPTPEAGWNALRRQVQILIDMNLTLYEFFGGKPGVYSGYAPAADRNRPAHYAEFVASRVGIDPSTPLQQYGTGTEAPDFSVTGTATADADWALTVPDPGGLLRKLDAFTGSRQMSIAGIAVLVLILAAALRPSDRI